MKAFLLLLASLSLASANTNLPATGPLQSFSGTVLQTHPALSLVQRAEVRYLYTGTAQELAAGSSAFRNTRLSLPAQTGVGGLVETPVATQRQLRQVQYNLQLAYLLSRQNGGLSEAELSVVPPEDRRRFQRTTNFSTVAVLHLTNVPPAQRLTLQALPIGPVRIEQHTYPGFKLILPARTAK